MEKTYTVLWGGKEVGILSDCRVESLCLDGIWLPNKLEATTKFHENISLVNSTGNDKDQGKSRNITLKATKSGREMTAMVVAQPDPAYENRMVVRLKNR